MFAFSSDVCWASLTFRLLAEVPWIPLGSFGLMEKAAALSPRASLSVIELKVLIAQNGFLSW